MKVSLVIPTYNCAPLLRTTLQSVRLCGWDDLEIIVRDGASRDDTVRQVEDFPDLPIRVVSEPDQGQYDAINKGFELATGEILGWINAGDLLMPGAIGNVADAFAAIPEMQWVTGRQCVAEGVRTRKVGERVLGVSNLEIRLGLCKGGVSGHLQQEGMFWRRSLWEEAGPLDLNYKLAADFELWTRFARVTKLYRLRVPLAAFSYHDTNRSITEAQSYQSEVAQAIERLPERLRKRHRQLSWLPLFWRVCRKLPLAGPVLRFVCWRLDGLTIQVVSFERQGGRFQPVCKQRVAWLA